MNYVQYTFVNASMYSGPIVEGWPPAKDRSVEPYMKGNYNSMTQNKIYFLFRHSFILAYDINFSQLLMFKSYFCNEIRTVPTNSKSRKIEQQNIECHCTIQTT